MTPGLVVVGGSYAAIQLITAARKHGWAEPIHLICAEPWLPYERPPLSKSFPVDAAEPDSLALRGAGFYAQQEVEVTLHDPVTEIDHTSRRVTLASGAQLDYRSLALTTGASARAAKLPGGDLDGVMTLRCLEDALVLRESLRTPRRVVSLGAGFIGLELAATLASAGHDVTVLDVADRVMARVLSPHLSEFLQQRHRAAGVRVLTNAQATEISGDGGRVRAVRLADGRVIDADIVIVGVGADPRTGLAEQAGAEVSDGVVVDARMRASAPALVAAGDCTRFAFREQYVRLESVQNAVEQGRIAGATVAGARLQYSATPWFWSDQYDIKLQLAGLNRPGLRQIVRGVPDSGRFSIVHLDDDDTVVAVDSANEPGEHLAARRLVAARIRIPPDVAADRDVPLKTHAARKAVPA